MTIAVHCPDADWNRARLLTASPSPPLRANGASSATMWTTRTAVPSGVLSGPVGIAAEYAPRAADAIGGKGDAGLEMGVDRIIKPALVPRPSPLFPLPPSCDSGSNRGDHFVGEHVDLVDRRVDVRRDPHSLELVVVHRRRHDVV